MTAIDFYPCSKKKYKLYFKGEDGYVDIWCATSFDFIDSIVIQNKLKQIQAFAEAQKELFLYGFAVCLDTCNNWTINYYFKAI